MRIEMPNRDEAGETRVQNSSNNLINRSENRAFSLLAWHTTGANGMRNNIVRTSVLRNVATAQPPLPPNSTRGLTPGLINPALGNFHWNTIPFPTRDPDQGRLRVGMGRRARAQAAAAANPPHPRSTKRRRSTREHKGRPSKRRRYTIEDSSDEDTMTTQSDGTKSSAVCIDVPSLCGSC